MAQPSFHSAVSMVGHETLKEAWRRQQYWRTPLPGIALPPGGSCTISGASGAAKTDLLYLFAVVFCARPNDRRLLWIDADGRFHPLRIRTVCRAVVRDPGPVLGRVFVQRARSALEATRIIRGLDPNEFVVVIDGSSVWIPLDSKQQFAALKQALGTFCQRGGMVCVSARDPPPAQWYRLLPAPHLTVSLTPDTTQQHVFVAVVSQGRRPAPRVKFKLRADEAGCAIIPFDQGEQPAA